MISTRQVTLGDRTIAVPEGGLYDRVSERRSHRTSTTVSRRRAW